MESRVFRVAALAALFLACATVSPPGGVWNEPAVRRVWPPGPETPRIEYVGAIRSGGDLGRERGWLDRLSALLFGEEPSGMRKPVAVARNAAGLLVVADAGFPTVHFFDLESRRYHRLEGRGASALRSPVGVAVDASGRAYVSDSVRGVVWVFDEKRELVDTWGEGGLSRPTGLALDSDGDRLYVVDTLACRVVIFDLDGTEVGGFGRCGLGPGEFNAPTHIAIAEDGRVFVADSLNFRIQSFTRDGTPLFSLGRPGDSAGDLARPKGVAADAGGRVYVVDAAFENVQIFDAEGKLLLAFGGPGAGAGEFALPAGLFLDSSGTLWVADSFNRRVQAFRLLADR